MVKRIEKNIWKCMTRSFLIHGCSSFPSTSTLMRPIGKYTNHFHLCPAHIDLLLAPTALTKTRSSYNLPSRRKFTFYWFVIEIAKFSLTNDIREVHFGRAAINCNDLRMDGNEVHVGRQVIGIETRKTGKEIDKSLLELIKTEFN